MNFRGLLGAAEPVAFDYARCQSGGRISRFDGWFVPDSVEDGALWGGGGGGVSRF